MEEWKDFISQDPCSEFLGTFVYFNFNFTFFPPVFLASLRHKYIYSSKKKSRQTNEPFGLSLEGGSKNSMIPN